MAGEQIDQQINPLTILAAYRNMLATKVTFGQQVMQANIKMLNLWSWPTGTAAADERPGVAAIGPEVITA